MEELSLWFGAPSILRTADGYLLIDVVSNGASIAARILRVSSDGTPVLSRTVHTTNHAYTRHAHQEVDGSFLLARGGQVLRIDQDAQVLMAKRYGEVGCTLREATPLSDGKPASVGDNYYSGDHSYRGVYLRTEPDGTVILARELSMDSIDVHPKFITADPFGGDIITGWVGASSIDPAAAAFIAHHDSTGTLQWAARVQVFGMTPIPKNAIVLSDGSSIICMTGIVNGEFSDRLVIMRFSADGIVQSVRGFTIQDGTNVPCYMNYAVASSDSTFVLSGYSVYSSLALNNLALLSFDNEANLLASAIYPFMSSSDDAHVLAPVAGENGLSAVISNLPDGFVVCSMDNDLQAAGCPTFTMNVVDDTLSYTVTYGMTETPLMWSALDEMQLFYTIDEPMTPELLCASGTEPVKSHPESTRIAPNPVGDRLDIIGQTIEQVQVFDAVGRLVRSSQTSPSPIVSLDVRVLSAGGYTVRVKSQGGFSLHHMVKL